MSLKWVEAGVKNKYRDVGTDDGVKTAMTLADPQFLGPLDGARTIQYYTITP